MENKSLTLRKKKLDTFIMNKRLQDSFNFLEDEFDKSQKDKKPKGNEQDYMLIKSKDEFVSLAIILTA